MSRLLVANRETGRTQHHRVSEIPHLVQPGTVMVFNDSRVRRARVFARWENSERRQEFLLLNPRSGENDAAGEYHRWLAIGPGARKLKPGLRFVFELPGAPEIPATTAVITAVEGQYRELTFDRPIGESWLELHGHVPLPPYIERDDVPGDAERYQTVYARVPGSAAAPTAGLHFTEELLHRLRSSGVETVFITLHVGLGTFLPVRTEHLDDHVMHREEYTISDDAARAINRARQEGRPVLAVGTTAVRTLESAAAVAAADAGNTDQTVQPGTGDTDIFIRPGYRFRVIDQMFTNFHTPESTLVALVSAFAGHEKIMTWYQEAIRERYRFFSYGDAMLIQ